jgi:polyhydroxyalkanoate synthase
LGRETDFDPRRSLVLSPTPSGAEATHRDGDAADRGDVDPPTPFDRLLRAGLARYSLGLSPAALWLAYADWAIHLAASPGKRAELAEKGFRKLVRFIAYAVSSAGRPDAVECISPLPQDRRFDSELWRKPPFNRRSKGVWSRGDSLNQLMM